MEFWEVLRLRRSTRKFLDKQITQAELDKILLAGCSAPVGSKLYGDIRLTVVQNREVLQSLNAAFNKRVQDRGELRKMAGALEAKIPPVILPFYGAPTVIVISHRIQDLQPGIEYANVACVAQTMHLAATDLGLGSVLAWGIFESMRVYPELDNSALLKLPEGFSPLLGLMVGYPAKPLYERELEAEKIAVNYI